MNTLLLSYDLGGPETSEDYKRLINAIKGYTDYKKGLESFWFVKTTKNSATVRDELKTYLDKNDKLIVINITGDGWGTSNFPSDVTDRMKANI